MKFFVTGVGGQLGHEGVGSDIQENYSGVTDGSAVTKAPYIALDITDKDAVEKVITEVNPDAVIHCAAWTAVDMAEDDDKVAKVRAINAGGTQNIADVCKKLDCKMTYISTDYVFDGQGTEPWQPDCKDYKPLNVYGQTKLEGELVVSQTLEKYFIVRIAWVFGLNGKNFIKTMEHEGRCVGNRVNAYTSGMDFHGGSKLSKLTYPIKTIYSKEARVQLRKVLDDFKPDVCHLNNFNYQLTPSIILEIVKWRKETGRGCKIIFTAHDYQLVCPNHMLNNPNTHQNCEKCLGGHFVNCMKGKCIHGSTAKSAIGMMEAEFWKWKGTYKYIDTMICCSEFMKSKMDSNPLFASKTVAMHNFIDKVEWKETPKKDYVLYFGRFSEEKGIGTLIKVCKELPDVQFIFAGTGPLEEMVNGIKNIKNVGFQKGEALEKLIREARFSIYPSEWYENCPFSVME